MTVMTRGEFREALLKCRNGTGGSATWFEIIDAFDAAQTVELEVQAAIRAWINCPAEKRPSTAALGQHIAKIAERLVTPETATETR